nr:S-layer homology domain-containing protein [Anaerovorax sp. IOR16]
MCGDEVTSVGVVIDVASSGTQDVIVNVPKQFLRSVLEKKDPYFKIKTKTVNISFDEEALKYLVKDSDYTISFSFSQWNESHFTYIAVDNGKKITDLNGGCATLEIIYATEFGVDGDRVDVYTDDKQLNKRTILKDISYNADSHQITFKADQLSIFEVVATDVVFKDTTNHWAKEAIERWSNIGIVKGFEGKFQPNANIKRGDMAVILGNLMGYSAKSEKKFTDLKDGVYYKDAILEADAAGVLHASGSEVHPEERISREEAVYMLCKALEIEEQDACKVSFKDQNQISEWAKGSMNAFINKGLISGFEGKVNAKDKITRAEIVTILNKAIPSLVNYGEFSEDVKGILLVNGGNTHLKNMTVQGDLLIGDGVGEHDVILENVNVIGRIIVRGGGDASIHVSGKSTLKTVEMKKVFGSVRLVAEEDGVVEAVIVKGGKDKVSLAGKLNKVIVDNSVSVRFEGAKVDALEVNAVKANVNVDSMSHIQKTEVKATAKNSKFDVSGEVLEMAVAAEGFLVEGTGKLDAVSVEASNVKIKTNGTEVTAAEGVSQVYAGKKLVAAGATIKSAGEKPKVSSSGKVDESISPTAPRIDTTLVDGKTIKPTKITFDVFAKDVNDKKIDCKVTLNEEEVPYNWDDKVKTSFTLELAEGTNIVVVSATADGETTKKTYTLYHIAVAEGESVGHAVFTVELLTLGAEYLIEPMEVEIFEGENSAQALLRVLDQYGFDYEYTGKPEKAFYLAHIKGVDGIVPMDLTNTPECLKAVLEKDEAEIEQRKDPDSLGEFDYTSMSGWMYSVNDVFPNVGFSDTYLQDGDVVRVQFTVWGYGRDIGGADAMGTYGSNFYPVADKTELLRKVAKRGYSSVSAKVKSTLTSLDADQSEVDKAL